MRACFEFEFRIAALQRNKTKVAKMKRTNVKSRIKKDELNPLFHFKDKEEDDKVLTKKIVKNALKTGKLELSNKHLKVGNGNIKLYH